METNWMIERNRAAHLDPGPVGRCSLASLALPRPPRRSASLRSAGPPSGPLSELCGGPPCQIDCPRSGYGGRLRIQRSGVRCSTAIASCVRRWSGDARPPGGLNAVSILTGHGPCPPAPACRGLCGVRIVDRRGESVACGLPTSAGFEAGRRRAHRCGRVASTQRIAAPAVLRGSLPAVVSLLISASIAMLPPEDLNASQHCGRSLPPPLQLCPSATVLCPFAQCKIESPRWSRFPRRTPVTLSPTLAEALARSTGLAPPTTLDRGFAAG